MLTVDELSQQEKERALKRRAIYRSLYEGAVGIIKRRHDVGETTAMYTVPGCVVGEMPYKLESAVKYITQKLKKGKFQVVVQDTTIYISWKRPMQDVLYPKKKKTKKTKKKKPKKKKIL